MADSVLRKERFKSLQPFVEPEYKGVLKIFIGAGPKEREARLKSSLGQFEH